MPTGSDLTLSHGLLVQVYPAGMHRERTTGIEQLLADHGLWKLVGDIPRLPMRPGLCLLSTGEQRWYLCRGDYPSSSLVEAVEQCVHASPGSLTIASSRRPHLRDICLHGRRCKGAVILVHLPPPVSPTAEHTPRQDAFLFVDYRPVGVRPFGFHQVGTSWDLKTILAKVPACTPEGYQVQVEGAWKDNTTLVAPSGTTVTVFLARILTPTGPPPGPAEPDSITLSAPSAPTRKRSRSPSGGRAHVEDPPAGSTPGPTDRLMRHAQVSTGSSSAINASGLLTAAAALLDTADAALLGPGPSFVAGAPALAYVNIGMCRALYGLAVLGGPLPAGLALHLHEGISPLPSRLLRPVRQAFNRTGWDGRAHLDRLRALTAALGGRWLRDARPIFPGAVEEIDGHGVDPSQPEDDDTVLHICCIILKVGHTPEELCVALAIPATQEEAETAVQAARDPAISRIYPSLVPVTPQPLTGTAVFLAGPAWTGILDGCCFDTTAVDGRLFVIRAPDYVSRHELVSLAHFRDACEVEVLVGRDQEPLLDEVPVHLFPGMLVTFLPAGEHGTARYTLGQQLQTHLVWSEWSLLEGHPSTDAYCLVCGDSVLLHFADPGAPTRYRDHIAATANIPTRSLRIQAAQPRPTDVALWGFACRSVLVVSSFPHTHPEGTLHHCLLDCRALCGTWQALRVHIQGQRVQDLLPQITDLPPLGHSLRIGTDPAHMATLCPGPGCILIAEYDRLQDSGDQSSRGAAPSEGSVQVSSTGTSGPATFSEASAADNTGPPKRTQRCRLCLMLQILEKQDCGFQSTPSYYLRRNTRQS